MTPQALVTGGAKGIGKAISMELAAQGWDLILCARDTFVLEQTAQKIKAQYGTQVHILEADFSKSGESRKVIEKTVKNSHIPEALICNAGSFGALGLFKNVDFDEWKKSFDLNFFSIAEMIQAYLRTIEGSQDRQSQRRKIIVLSGGGLGGSKVRGGASAYFVAKAALYRLVEVIHEEGYPIDINCIAPGAVKSGITEQAIQAGQANLGTLYHEQLNVMNQGGDPPELAAHMVALLLSSACDGISGRLMSAKWDRKYLESPELLKKLKTHQDLFRLRRVDEEMFGRLSEP